MPTQRATKKAKVATTLSGAPSYLTVSDARELVDSMLRKAFSEQSRNLESHLNDIHKRLIKLEK